MSFLSLVYAAESPLPSSSLMQNNGLMSLFPFVIIFFIFYFLLIRPQVKKQKELQSTIESLKKGDKVIAVGGIIGTIHKIENDLIQLEVSPEVKIKVTKTSINGLFDAK